MSATGSGANGEGPSSNPANPPSTPSLPNQPAQPNQTNEGRSALMVMVAGLAQIIKAQNATSREQETGQGVAPTLPNTQYDEGTAAERIKVYPGATMEIPDDLVVLSKAGICLPLSTLTLAAVRDFHANGRAYTFSPKMTGRASDLWNEMHHKDKALPLGEWCQAVNSLMYLWLQVGAYPENMEPSQHPPSLLSEHVLLIISRLTSENWPVWREYDRRVRKAIWSEHRRPGAGLSFRIDSLNQELLQEAELEVTNRADVATDLFSLLHSTWATVMRSTGQEIGKILRRVNDDWAWSASRADVFIVDLELGLAQGSVSASERRREEGPLPPHLSTRFSARAQHFLAPMAGFSAVGRSTPPLLHQPSIAGRPPQRKNPARFCIVCTRVTPDHTWYNCPGPHPPQLKPLGEKKGWVWDGKQVPVCARFNAGLEPKGSECWNGHYCTQCGRDEHQAIEHGSTRAAAASTSVHLVRSFRNNEGDSRPRH